MTFTRFTVDSSTPSLWRVTFDHPPINLIDYVMIGELGELLAEVERNEEPAVLVFNSADPDYFLAHYDIAAVNEASLPADEGFPPQMDAFWKAVARPALQARASRAFEDGLQQRSDVELRLGEYVGHLSKASQ
jgi:enoyl-CoA hydratase/carnithine racemase